MPEPTHTANGKRPYAAPMVNDLGTLHELTRDQAKKFGSTDHTFLTGTNIGLTNASQ